MKRIKICRRCHYRFWDDEDCCRSRETQISDAVTGKRFCRDINRDGTCEFFRPDARIFFRGMMIFGALILCTLFVMPLQKCLKESREVRSIEAVRKAEIAEARAKQPVKVYEVEKMENGNYSIKEFHPKR